MKRGVERFWVVATVSLILWFYSWTVWTTMGQRWPVPHGDEGDYFNLLSRGFLDGHLYMKAEVPAELIHAENPYDPSKRPPGVGMHDVSYYKGRYYLYFGAAPVVALYVPYRLITGRDLPQPYGNLLFVSFGFLFAVRAWLYLRGKYFPASRTYIALLGILALGCCGMTFSVLRRASIWELPISAGYAFAMLAIALALRGGLARRAAGWWIFAGIALGLAVGSRPSYIVGSVIVAVLVGGRWWLEFRKKNTWWGGVDWLKAALAFGISLGTVVIALLAYNYFRFGKFSEFGLNYQLTGMVESKVKHFSLSFMPFNAYIYYLAPAQWSRYFPFVQFIRPPEQPHDYYGFEYPYGVFTNMPVTLVAFLWPVVLWRRPPNARWNLAVIGVGLTAFFLAMGTFLAGFVTGAQRYMTDFTPSLTLLASFGLLGVERFVQARSAVVRGLTGTVIGAGVVFSVFFGVMTSFQLHGILKAIAPTSYDHLAYMFNYPSYWWEKITHFRHGPLEITLRFPKGKSGQLEPLISTGWEFYSDHIFLHYVDDRHVQIGMDHTSRGTIVSAPVEVDFDVDHVIRAEMGSLFPPAEHPFFKGKSDLEKSSLTRWLRVMVDDKTVIETVQPYYESSPESIQVGGNNYTKMYGGRFTGKIVAVRRGAYQVLSEPRGVFGPVILKILFPTGCVGRNQPLLATGVPGAADTFYVINKAENTIKFGYDHWGAGAIESPELEIQHSAPHRVTIRLPSLMAPSSKPSYSVLQRSLLVIMDDRVVWATNAEFHPASPAELYFGRNGVYSSVCEPQFTGTFTSIEREPDLAEPAERDPDRIFMKLVFPTGKTGHFEPLFARGEAGQADILLVEYIDQDHVRFGIDHWGVGLIQSPVVAVNLGLIHDIDVRFDSSAGAPTGTARLSVSLDKTEIWKIDVPVYPVSPKSIRVGLNQIGASTCEPMFSGVLLGFHFKPIAP